MSLLTLAQFRARTTMPSSDVDALELTEPGWLLERLEDETAYIEARLAKRYLTPFAPNGAGPRAALRWLTDIMTELAYEKRGYNPASAQDGRIAARADVARAEVKEAADSADGLFDLPLRQDAPSASGISKGGPFGYSEASPYTSMDVQAERARDERWTR